MCHSSFVGRSWKDDEGRTEGDSLKPKNKMTLPSASDISLKPKEATDQRTNECDVQ